MKAPESKWITFHKAAVTRQRKTPVFLVTTKEHGKPEESGGQVLGRVSWYAPWRRYSFFPELGTLFESQCLSDIAAFCDWLMAERKAASHKTIGPNEMTDAVELPEQQKEGSE